MTAAEHLEDEPDIWRALANPVRRTLLDELATGPRTTGDLAAAIPELSRFAVMQHLGVLTDVGLVLVRRRGRHRFNHLNAVPLRRWYEQWVGPVASAAAAGMLALEGTIEERGEATMATNTETARTVHIETEMRFRASPQRVFRAITEQTQEWFPMTYGEDRVKAVVLEPWVGGRQFEDWGDGRGHLYGHVTAYDPPDHVATRGWLVPGTILDTSYRLTADGGHTILAMSKTAFGPMTEDEAQAITTHGDIANFEAPLRALVEE